MTKNLIGRNPNKQQFFLRILSLKAYPLTPWNPEGLPLDPLGRRNHRKAYLIMLITLCLPHPIRDYVIYGQPIKLGKLGTLPNHYQSHLL